MKKVFAVLLTVMLAFAALPLKAFATENEEKKTPSGIAYSDIGKSIDSYISEREKGLAACEVSVFDTEGTIYNGYYGYADMENKVKADEQTVIDWGSTSKILVWVSVMQQYEKGNIDLDADIRTYLPEGFLTKLQYPDEKITMIDLMNHKAGFQESFYENQKAKPNELFSSLKEAVKKCECYQAFHVGECTAYSNWSTALAAYIVERTSGKDYVTYVNENILAPLEMKHTSVDQLQRDNEWVAKKRHNLKCYSITLNSSESYGEGRAYVQLFPVGAVISTLEDFSRFGQALVNENSPLFKDNKTREEMFKATSFFGDTKVAKNCHGLWTMQHKVETLGHGGNTNCTANLEFDPVSGLGVAVLTNEAGETAFCNGIPCLIFGSMTDREGFIPYTGTVPDLSGMYYSKRSIIEGAGRGYQYLSGVYPLARNNDGTYSIKLFGFKFNDGIEVVPVGENQYIFKDNGAETFIYIKDGIYEYGYMDLQKSSTGALPTIASYAFILFGLVCFITVIVKLIAILVRKCRRTSKPYSEEDKLIFAQQMIYGVSGIILALFFFVITFCNPAFVKASCILAGALALASVNISGLLAYKTSKSKDVAAKKIRNWIWVILTIAYPVFIWVMELHCFWKL
jgi:CubicO group peptidase (beta-lactamase class C family)